MIGANCSQSLKKGIGNGLDNNIQSRVAEIYQLLVKNNAAFTKGIPSEEQLKALLQHSFNCYDQLDFICLDYARHSCNYLDPKQMADSIHKIMRSTKYLINHLRYWFDAFSIQIFKKNSEIKFNLQLHKCLKPHCYMCRNNINQMKVKEARESILGPTQWRQIYQEELRHEKETIKKEQLFQNKVESKEYISSVNFLSKIIREMQESAKNYDKLAQKVENDYTDEDLTLYALQELLGKLKYRLGEKYRAKFHSKLKDLLRKFQQKGIGTSTNDIQYQIISQVDLIVLPNETKQKSSATIVQDTLMRKLKDDNKRLLTQNMDLTLRFQALKENTVKNMMNNTLHRSLSRKNSQHHQKSHIYNPNDRSSEFLKPRNTLGQYPHNKEKIQTREKSQQPKLSHSYKNKKSKLIGKMSGFHLKKFENRKSQLSELIEKGIAEDNQEDKRIFQRENEESNESIDWKEQNQQKIVQKKEAYCQWDQRISDSISQKRVGNIKSPSMKKNQMLAIIRGDSEPNISSEKDSMSKMDSHKTLVPPISTKKLLTHNADLAISKNNTIDNITKRQAKSIKRIQQNYGFQHIIQHAKQKKNQSHFAQNYEQKQQKTCQTKTIQHIQTFHKNRTSHQKNRLSYEKHAQSNKKGFLYKAAKMETQYQPNKQDSTFDNIRYSNLKDERMRHLKDRIATQSSGLVKKIRVIRNIIFKPEHLAFFGGVSESYGYQNWKAELKLENLTENERDLLKQLKQFMENLKNFKNSFYQNVYSFLKSPYQMVQKNQIQYKPSKSQITQKLLLKLMLFHKKKCGTANCGHLGQFLEAIGFVRKESN